MSRRPPHALDAQPMPSGEAGAPRVLDVTVAELVPGDLVALSARDLSLERWYVVMHTLPERPDTIRLTLRPPLGGTDHDEFLDRLRTVTVRAARVDPAAVPRLVSLNLRAADFRDGDRIGFLRVVDPRAVEETYVRRRGRWELEDPGAGPRADTGPRTDTGSQSEPRTGPPTESASGLASGGEAGTGAPTAPGDGSAEEFPAATLTDDEVRERAAEAVDHAVRHLPGPATAVGPVGRPAGTPGRPPGGLPGRTVDRTADGTADTTAGVRHGVRHGARSSEWPVRGGAGQRGRRVVVTGLGAITPLGIGVTELWAGLLEGRCGIRELEGEEFADLPVRIAGTVAADPAALLPRPQARRMNRAAQFAVLAAREAWTDAGFDPAGTAGSGLDPRRVGVSAGAILGDASVLVDGDRALREKGPRGVSPLTTPMTVPSQAASQVSLALGITGEARTVTSACASGTEAIGQAVDRIRYGRVDVALAGGAEAVVTPAIMAAFAAMRALSTHRPTDGESPSRPFAKDRDGFVNGEGAGFLVLEAEEHARARGARVYCEAAGWGLSADAHHLTAPEPSGSGVALALRRALEDARAEAADVVHVNAHATATVDGDLAEAAAVAAVLGRWVPVTALKGHLGHLQGAAGGVEAVASVLTLHHGVIPATIGRGELDEEIGLDVVRKQHRPLPRPREEDVVLSNSFGFGGHNAVLALRRGWG